MTGPAFGHNSTAGRRSSMVVKNVETSTMRGSSVPFPAYTSTYRLRHELEPASTHWFRPIHDSKLRTHWVLTLCGLPVMMGCLAMETINQPISQHSRPLLTLVWKCMRPVSLSLLTGLVLFSGLPLEYQRCDIILAPWNPVLIGGPFGTPTWRWPWSWGSLPISPLAMPLQLYPWNVRTSHVQA